MADEAQGTVGRNEEVCLVISIIVALIAGGIALLFAGLIAMRVVSADPGNQRMQGIGDAIRGGASAFCAENTWRWFLSLW
jgi:Na+/H+-translocating membrane pyrophosphatase